MKKKTKATMNKINYAVIFSILLYLILTIGLFLPKLVSSEINIIVIIVTLLCTVGVSVYLFFVLLNSIALIFEDMQDNKFSKKTLKAKSRKRTGRH